MKDLVNSISLGEGGRSRRVGRWGSAPIGAAAERARCPRAAGGRTGGSRVAGLSELHKEIWRAMVGIFQWWSPIPLLEPQIGAYVFLFLRNFRIRPLAVATLGRVSENVPH